MKMIDECALPFPGKIMTSTTFDSPTGSSVTSKHKPCKALQLTDIEQGPESYVDRSNLAESQHQQHQKHLASLQFLITVLIFLIGAAASATILVSGINSAKRDQENDFEKVSSDLLVEFDVALNDYLVAGQWVHQAFRTSRKGSQTQRDFAEMYENLISTGLEFQAVTLAMNVSANEREAMENESRDFVKQYHPSINYTGFRAFGDGSTIPAPQAPFYFPVHFIAPMELSGKNLDLNLYTSTTRKNAIDKALQTWKPVLTEPAILGHQIGEESPALRSVILVHPGIPLSSRPDVVPRDAVFMGIRIPDVIRRAHKNLPLQKCRVSVFLYDSTDTTRENQPFLGGAMMNEYRDGGIAEDSNTDDDGVVFTPATELSSVLARKDHYHHSIVYPIASREWTFVVVASKDEFSSNITFVILSAVMFFVACTCTALWVHTHYRRVAKMTELRSKVETEKHAIVVENARNATRLEREMNDFIAHEVRNPLAAAVSACSFVSCAVNETQPLVDDKSRASVREDVAIIDTSLQFINDLLRNMLDMHRASSNQLVIETSPVSILDDILQPVTSMLYRRGMDIEFLVDCPQNLIVESDRLRLKQIVLNLGRNAVKFVEKGFVRFRAGLVKGRVYLYIEDSGPGIPLKKRHNLFAKFQESLDSMSQGTGFGELRATSFPFARSTKSF